MKTITPSAFVVKDDAIMIFLSDGTADMQAFKQQVADYAAVDVSKVEVSPPAPLPAVIKVVTVEGPPSNGAHVAPDKPTREDPEDHDSNSYPGKSAEDASKAAREFYRVPPQIKPAAPPTDLSPKAGYDGLFRKGR